MLGDSPRQSGDPAKMNIAEQKIEIKLKLLKLSNEQTQKIAEERNLKTIERHRKLLEGKINECHELKAEVQEKKLENGDGVEGIRNWSVKVEENVAEYEKVVEELEGLERDLKERDSRLTQEKEEKTRWEIKKKFTKKSEENEGKPRAKLPKLVITKFQGTHLDWQRFWGQFEADIDKSELGQVAKFSYLKELLIPKVRATIDGLPFNSEGYERAENILKTKYGRPSEVANAHIQSIMSLPIIHGSNPVKITEFYEKLVSSIQTLETMGKQGEFKGYVRHTLYKLPGIRADLVRLDENWQEWGFSQLVEALRKWCERNPVPLESHKQGAPGWSGEGHHRRERANERVLQAKQEDWKPRPCVYCNSRGHKSAECDKIKGVADRRKY